MRFPAHSDVVDCATAFVGRGQYAQVPGVTRRMDEQIATR
jgi:hypothetical protein